MTDLLLVDYSGRGDYAWLRPEACDTCLFCDPMSDRFGDDCNVVEHERCDRCGHCKGNHAD